MMIQSNINNILSDENLNRYNEYLNLYDFYIVEERDANNLRLLEIKDCFGVYLMYYLYYDDDEIYLDNDELSKFTNIKDDIFYKLLNRLLEFECSNLVKREKEYILTINRLADCVDNFISYRRKQLIKNLLNE